MFLRGALPRHLKHGLFDASRERLLGLPLVALGIVRLRRGFSRAEREARIQAKRERIRAEAESLAQSEAEAVSEAEPAEDKTDNKEDNK